MEHIKLFEYWTPQTANLQKVKITVPFGHFYDGEKEDGKGKVREAFIYTGHLIEKPSKDPEYNFMTMWYFIPEKGGFEYLNIGNKISAPSYTARRNEEEFNKYVGKECSIKYSYQFPIKIEKGYLNHDIWIGELIWGMDAYIEPI